MLLHPLCHDSNDAVRIFVTRHPPGHGTVTAVGRFSAQSRGLNMMIKRVLAGIGAIAVLTIGVTDQAAAESAVAGTPRESARPNVNLGGHGAVGGRCRRRDRPPRRDRRGGRSDRLARRRPPGRGPSAGPRERTEHGGRPRRGRATLRCRPRYVRGQHRARRASAAISTAVVREPTTTSSPRRPPRIGRAEHRVRRPHRFGPNRDGSVRRRGAGRRPLTVSMRPVIAPGPVVD